MISIYFYSNFQVVSIPRSKDFQQLKRHNRINDRFINAFD